MKKIELNLINNLSTSTNCIAIYRLNVSHLTSLILQKNPPNLEISVHKDNLISWKKICEEYYCELDNHLNEVKKNPHHKDIYGLQISKLCFANLKIEIEADLDEPMMHETIDFIECGRIFLKKILKITKKSINLIDNAIEVYQLFPKGYIIPVDKEIKEKRLFKKIKINFSGFQTSVILQLARLAFVFKDFNSEKPYDKNFAKAIEYTFDFYCNGELQSSKYIYSQLSHALGKSNDMRSLKIQKDFFNQIDPVLKEFSENFKKNTKGINLQDFSKKTVNKD